MQHTDKNGGAHSNQIGYLSFNSLAKESRLIVGAVIHSIDPTAQDVLTSTAKLRAVGYF
ncbi:hypothetical protein HUU62_09035 [Rhodoferax sp. 4810]|nr:hypothetical protein [Rhodoferax jenense]